MPYPIELEKTPEAYIFSPKAAVELIKIERRQNRKTPPRKRTIKRKRNPQRKPGECYNHRSYRKAVSAAIERAGVPHWSPNQLRHTKATEVEQLYGIEDAQIRLGHSSKEVTAVYLDPEVKKKEQIEAVKNQARKQHSNK